MVFSRRKKAGLMRSARRHSGVQNGHLGASNVSSAAEDKRFSSIEFAWRVHRAQESWANKADVKASIVLALEGGGLFAIISAHATDGALAHLGGWHLLVQNVGLALLLLATVFAVVAVYPKIRIAGTDEVAVSLGTIYFGHVRRWDAPALAKQLKELTPDEELQAVSRQLVAMSKSNWNKLRCIQVSLALALVGFVLISIGIVSIL